MKTVVKFPVALKTAQQDDPCACAGVRVERRLAAILMADVAGYSRLVGADEHGTLEQWRAHWDELIEPTLTAHAGRVVRITGDGILAEFASVVNAVRCAVALQGGMRARNADVATDARMEFRIGLHVGDIIIDRGDMWGEGVNVAARLEALAEPGGLCVSGRVAEEVASKLDVAFEDLGVRELKNIARPVRVFRARLSPLSPPSSPLSEPSSPGLSRRPRSVGQGAEPSGMAGTSPAMTPREGWPTARGIVLAIANGVGIVLLAAAWWMAAAPAILAPGSDRGSPLVKDRIGVAGEVGAPIDDRLRGTLPSIVVLPFTNLSGDARQDYVVDGITDSLISDLVRALPHIFVVSRETAFTYKGRAADARQIGRELEVRYLLEGSVALDGDRVRVNVRLTETRDGSQLWSERFDTERKGMLAMQDEIVSRVSRAIGLKVVDLEARRSLNERPGSGELTDLIMRGKAVLNKPSSAATMLEARGLFEQALTVQPTSVDALAGVASTLVFEFLNGYYDTGGDKRLRRAEALIERALAIDPRHLQAMKARAALRRAQGKLDDAIAAAEAVIAENPGEPWAYKEIGLDALYLGRPEQALEWFAKADRIGPRDPMRWTWLDARGHALILLGRDEEAIRTLISALDANPKNAASRAFLAAAYALAGRLDDARDALAAYDAERPGTRISTFRTLAPVPLALTSAAYQAQRARLAEGLRLAGMPE
jgi:adenylate cyclase